MYGGGKQPLDLKIQKHPEKEIIENIRNRFKLKNKNEAIKDRIFRDIMNVFELVEEDYNKPVRVSNFWNKNHVKYETNDDKNKTLLIKNILMKLNHN